MAPDYMSQDNLKMVPGIAVTQCAGRWKESRFFSNSRILISLWYFVTNGFTYHWEKKLGQNVFYFLRNYELSKAFFTWILKQIRIWQNIWTKLCFRVALNLLIIKKIIQTHLIWLLHILNDYKKIKYSLNPTSEF